MTAGMALTHDKSHIAGWYKSKITCGPEPKPIQTCMTPHSMALLFGILLQDINFTRVYSAGRTMKIWCYDNCASIQKWINLMSLMLGEYKIKIRGGTLQWTWPE
jgi:hypothetical protein